MARSTSNADETKVTRAIEKYALDSLNEDLETRRETGESLRGLADFVNRRILESALTQAGGDVITEAESLYGLLTDEDVSAGRRAEIETKLERAGVDVQAVRSDFVSHQTVKHHLNDRLGVDTSRESSLDRETAISRIDWSRSRNEALIRNTLDQLESNGELDACEYSVSSSIRVSCAECGRTFALHEFVERGSCGCADVRE